MVGQPGQALDVVSGDPAAYRARVVVQEGADVGRWPAVDRQQHHHDPGGGAPLMMQRRYQLVVLLVGHLGVQAGWAHTKHRPGWD
jgi:hypothetical protein